MRALFNEKSAVSAPEKKAEKKTKIKARKI